MDCAPCILQNSAVLTFFFFFNNSHHNSWWWRKRDSMWSRQQLPSVVICSVILAHALLQYLLPCTAVLYELTMKHNCCTFATPLFNTNEMTVLCVDFQDTACLLLSPSQTYTSSVFLLRPLSSSPLLSSPSLSPQPSLVSPAVQKLYWMLAEPLRGNTLNASAIILLIMASHTYTHGDTRAARGWQWHKGSGSYSVSQQGY